MPPSTKGKLTATDVGSVIRNSLIFGLPIFAAAVGNKALEEFAQFDLGIYAELLGVVVGTVIKAVDRWSRNTPE